MAKNIPKTQGWNVRDDATVNKPATTANKVNLKHEDFDDLILNQGQRVKIYRSAFCPNVKSIDGAEHEIDCPLCHGAQFIDLHPICTWAFVQGLTLEKGVFAEGNYDGNTATASFLQGAELQYFTLVELVDHSEIFYERIKRQQGMVDILRYPGLRVNFIFDKNGVEYYEGSDFSLDANKNVKWCPNKGPVAGVIYTIHYECTIRYRAEKAMHSNRFAQVDNSGKALVIKMNEQWILQKDYLVERKDLDGNLMESNQISD